MKKDNPITSKKDQFDIRHIMIKHFKTAEGQEIIKDLIDQFPQLAPLVLKNSKK